MYFDSNSFSFLPNEFKFKFDCDLNGIPKDIDTVIDTILQGIK